MQRLYIFLGWSGSEDFNYEIFCRMGIGCCFNYSEGDLIVRHLGMGIVQKLPGKVEGLPSNLYLLKILVAIESSHFENFCAVSKTCDHKI